MSENEIIKASGNQNFFQIYTKNINIPQERKIIVSANAAIPSFGIGSIDIKGMFSLFKHSERVLTPIFTLDNDKTFKIKYNLIKNNANIEVNYPKENTFIKSINYQIAQDKSNTKCLENKLNILTKKNIKISLNNDINVTYFHITKKMKNLGRLKYKYSSKGFNNLLFQLNTSLFKNYLFYFNNMELNLNKLYLENKNIHGIYFNYQRPPYYGLNLLSGICFNNGFHFNNFTTGLYIKNILFTNYKFENCFVYNIEDFLDKKGYLSYVFCFSFKNYLNCKFKFINGDLKTFFLTKFKNVSISTNFNFDNYLNFFKGPRNNFKYSISINFK